MAKILVADGDIDNRQLYISILEKLGHDVVVCSNGKETIDEFNQQVFSLLMLDVKLKGLDGLEVCHRIRQTPNGLQLPIIMISEQLEECDVLRCFNCGANDYIMKPINPTILTVKLKNFLQISSLHSHEYEMVSNHVIFLNRYEIKKILGYGAHSVVFLAFDQFTEKNVAVKMINQNVMDVQMSKAYLEQIGRLKNVKSPRLLKIHDCGESNSQIYLIMEYAPEGNLKKRITIHSLSESETIHLALEIIEAIQELNRHHLCHFDIKPENILISNGDYKLTDFGMSTPRASATVPLHREIWSTAAYAAPETFEEVDGLDSKADIYSLGVTLFEAITGDNPFMSDKPAVTMFRQVNFEAPSLGKMVKNVSLNFSAIIEDMLAKNKDERPSLEHLYGQLREIDEVYKSGKLSMLSFPDQEPLLEDNQTRLFMEMTRRSRHEAMQKIRADMNRKNKHGYADRMANNLFSFLINRNQQSNLSRIMFARYVLFVLMISAVFNLVGYYCYGAFQRQDEKVKEPCLIMTMCTKCAFIESKPLKTIYGDKCTKCGAKTGFPVSCKPCRKSYVWNCPEFQKGLSFDKAMELLKSAQRCKYCNSLETSYIAPVKGGGKK